MILTIGKTKIYAELWRHHRQTDGPDHTCPLVVTVHGGPGVDHNYFKPELLSLSESANVLLYDQRGHGRSDHEDPNTWNLAQWASDLHEIIRFFAHNDVYVLGNSFGGIVAQQFAIHYAADIQGLILSSTMMRLDTNRIIDGFHRISGDEAREVAQTFWQDPKVESARSAYRRVCGPLYNTRQNVKRPPINRNDDVLKHFYGIGGEGRCFDFTSKLASITVPTLILGGEKDPVSTIEDSVDIYDTLTDAPKILHIFKNCGHGPFRDDPDTVLPVIQCFLAARP